MKTINEHIEQAQALKERAKRENIKILIRNLLKANGYPCCLNFRAKFDKMEKEL